MCQSPAAPTLKSTEELPEQFELTEQEYEWQEGDAGITLIMGKRAYQMPRQQPKVKTVTHQLPLVRRDTARAAQHDLQTVLRLIDKGHIIVSEKTLQASSATVAEIASLLRDGDFYEPTPKKEKWDAGDRPAQSLCLAVARAGGETRRVARQKTGADESRTSRPQCPTGGDLALLWQRWLKSKLLDEFNRIDAIKGQHGKGKRAMTAVEGRRAVIADRPQAMPGRPLGAGG